MVKKIILAIISIPWAIFCLIFNIIFLPIVIFLFTPIAIFWALVTWLKGDADWRGHFETWIELLLIGVVIYLDTIWDVELF